MLGGALSWLKQIYKSYEYWKDYKGDRVVVRTSEDLIAGENKDLIKTKVVEIEGTVNDVKALPPGFLLEDVERRISIENNSLVFGLGRDKAESIPGSSGDMTIRRIDKKFVSFDSIEELEFAEDNENSFNPLKKDSNID